MTFNAFFPYNRETKKILITIPTLSGKEVKMPVPEELLKILACPKCKGDIEYNPAKNWLVCKNCKLAYRIEDDIPIMLIDEAIPLKDEE